MVFSMRMGNCFGPSSRPLFRLHPEEPYRDVLGGDSRRMLALRTTSPEMDFARSQPFCSVVVSGACYGRGRRPPYAYANERATHISHYACCPLTRGARLSPLFYQRIENLELCQLLNGTGASDRLLIAVDPQFSLLKTTTRQYYKCTL